MEPITNFIKTHKISMKVENVPSRPDAREYSVPHHEKPFHYKIRLIKGTPQDGDYGEFCLFYSMGFGHAKKISQALKNISPKCVAYAEQIESLRRMKSYIPQPKLEDILDSLAMDVAGVIDHQSFEDWAGDYGYDPDSRKAEKVYRACQKLCSDLVGLLGKDTVEALVYETERL